MKKLICFSVSASAVLYGGFIWAAPHKMRVNDPTTTKALVASGGKIIADYGAFSVVEADDALLTGANASHAQIHDTWNLIRLNARQMDTRAPEIKALRQPRGQFAGKRLHLVQFAGPVKREWYQALRQTGAQIVTFIPENTYLVYGDAPALSRLQAWAAASQFVQWEGEYTHDLKIHPKAQAAAATRIQGRTPAYAFEIQLIVDPGANTTTLALLDGLKTAPVQSDYQIDNYRNLVVTLPADQLDTIAALPDVISIRPYVEPKKRDERQDQIIAGNINANVPSAPGYLAWLASKGFTQAQFTASGFIVDVADSGIDNGTTTPGHFGLYANGDSTQSSRVAYNRFEGRPHLGGTLEGCDGHGTLNSHIIGNYDGYTGSQHQDSVGFSYGVGVCPFVKVGSSVIFDNSGGFSDYTNPNFYTMATDAYSSGARIVNNSWGSDVSGDYDAAAQTYDKLTRDAQALVVGNQQMVYVFAAGNAGPCSGSTSPGIDSPGTAKNVISVGASENVRSLTPANGGNDPNGQDNCGQFDSDAADANSVSCYSSQGPCADGRMKPDLVAPGIHITGGVPQNSPPPSPTGTGLAIDCFDAFGVCALTGSGNTQDTNNFFPLGQQFYTESSGTSHSTPAVAGACALVRQYFINNGGSVPSPAMTKAYLMNSARYMTGQNANDTLWSPSQGMGELNLGMAFDGVQRFLRDQLPMDMFTATGQIRTFIGHVSDTSQPFRVTVAWTDAPGSSSAAAFMNDLDLAVSVNGNTYLGNVFNGQYSMTGGSADGTNNVESVFLPAGASGEFTVTVTGANINSEGVPNGGKTGNQDFALVIYNGSATNVPSFTPMAAAYDGLFYEAAGPELGRSGAITLQTTDTGSYSGKLQIGSTSSSFTGLFNGKGQATNNVSQRNSPSLQVVLDVDVNDPALITGTVSVPGTWTADLQANLMPFSLLSNPTPLAGPYTLILPGTNGSTQLPAGDSYATISMDASGKVKLTGATADGARLSQSAAIGGNGQYPFYAALNSGQEQLLGWLLFSNSPPSISGNVSWLKAPVAKSKFYTNGFNFETTALGSKYNPSANPLISFNNGLVILTGGNLPDTITNSVSVAGTAVSGTNRLSMKINAANGSYSGSVVDPTTGKSVKYNGVYLPEQNMGAGFFLGTNQSGPDLFTPAN